MLPDLLDQSAVLFAHIVGPAIVAQVVVPVELSQVRAGLMVEGAVSAPVDLRVRGRERSSVLPMHVRTHDGLVGSRAVPVHHADIHSVPTGLLCVLEVLALT